MSGSSGDSSTTVSYAVDCTKASEAARAFSSGKYSKSAELLNALFIDAKKQKINFVTCEDDSYDEDLDSDYDDLISEIEFFLEDKDDVNVGYNLEMDIEDMLEKLEDEEKIKELKALERRVSRVVDKLEEDFIDEINDDRNANKEIEEDNDEIEENNSVELEQKKLKEDLLWLYIIRDMRKKNKIRHNNDANEKDGLDIYLDYLFDTKLIDYFFK